MTPNDLDVLIHYYVSPTKHPRFEAPAVQDAISRWVSNNCMQWLEEENTYVCTPRGNAHMCQLLSVPLPTLSERWVDYKGDVL